MPDFHSVESYALGGGENLTDAPEVIQDGEARLLENVRFTGEGRWTTRRAAATLASGFRNLCGVHAMPHGTDTANGAANGGVYLDHDGGRVQLYAADGQGKNKQLVGTLAGWSNVGQRPKTHSAVIRECLWIVDEAKQHGLSVYDPAQRFGQGKLFQPKFKFDRSLNTPISAIYARAVVAYLNFLFVAGYGTEADADRPEIVRFSYLGLEEQPLDAGGAGDAGKQVNPAFDPLDPASEEEIPLAGATPGLFDLDDYFAAGARGIPVVSMTSAAERLAIATRFAAYLLFGYDRDSFRLDLIDNQRGSVAGRGMGEGNGAAWWYSPLGPCYWEGGGVVPLELRQVPRLAEIDLDTLFFAHQRTESEIRWYFSSDGGDPNRAICFNYLRNRWRSERLGRRIFCVGSARPGTILKPAAGGNPVPGDEGEPGGGDTSLSAPTGFVITGYTDGGVANVAGWVNGETAPGTLTEFWWSSTGGTLEGPPGVFSPAPNVARFKFAELEAGVAFQIVGGLIPGASTTFEIRHARNGLFSTFATLNFTVPTATASNPLVGPPRNFELEDASFQQNVLGGLGPRIRVKWQLGQQQVRTELWSKRPQFGPTGAFLGYGAWSVLRTLAENVSEYLDRDVRRTSPTARAYYYKARHLDREDRPSAFTNELSLAL